jgi:hypothetical protein
MPSTEPIPGLKSNFGEVRCDTSESEPESHVIATGAIASLESLLELRANDLDGIVRRHVIALLLASQKSDECCKRPSRASKSGSQSFSQRESILSIRMIEKDLGAANREHFIELIYFAVALEVGRRRVV